MSVPDLSVVLPVFNEEGNLPVLAARLQRVLRGEVGARYEIIFVDDGSTDGSRACLEMLHRQDRLIRVLRLSRNFGQHAALRAGLDAARGAIVALMDSDLQDLPEALPLLLRKLEEGYDVVRARRLNRQHSLFKRVTSFLFGRAINMLVKGYEIDTTVFRVARRPVVDAVKACREQNRFVLGLFGWVGFRQTSVPVPHGARLTGQSKYTLGSMLALAANVISGFSSAPLHLLTGLAGLVLCGGCGLTMAATARILFGGEPEGWLVVLAATTLLSGVQLLTLAMLGAYLGRSQRELQDRPLYVVAAELGEVQSPPVQSTTKPLRIANG